MQHIKLSRHQNILACENVSLQFVQSVMVFLGSPIDAVGGTASTSKFCGLEKVGLDKAGFVEIDNFIVAFAENALACQA